MIGAGGGVGAHLVQVARSCGAVVAGVDRSADKLALIEDLGAVALDAAGFGGTRIEPWDGPVDAVVDLVGTTESLPWGLDQLGQGGRLCVVTTFRDVALPVGHATWSPVSWCAWAATTRPGLRSTRPRVWSSPVSSAR